MQRFRCARGVDHVVAGARQNLANEYRTARSSSTRRNRPGAVRDRGGSLSRASLSPCGRAILSGIQSDSSADRSAILQHARDVRRDGRSGTPGTGSSPHRTARHHQLDAIEIPADEPDDGVCGSGEAADRLQVAITTDDCLESPASAPPPGSTLQTSFSGARRRGWGIKLSEW